MPIPLVERSKQEIEETIKRKVGTIREVKGVRQLDVRISGKRIDVAMHLLLDSNRARAYGSHLPVPGGLRQSFLFQNIPHKWERMVLDLDLFAWWAISISGGSIFLTLVSIYLYAEVRATRRRREQIGSKIIVILQDFAFVWVLLGLLVFYIISVNIGSATIFAVGNIFVEVLLALYLIRHRRKA